MSYKISANHIKDFIAHFASTGTDVTIELAGGRISADYGHIVVVHKIEREYRFEIQQGANVFMVDFVADEDDITFSFMLMLQEYSVDMEYFDDSRQLWLTCENRDKLIDAILDTRFPAGIWPNSEPTDPMEVSNE